MPTHNCCYCIDRPLGLAGSPTAVAYPESRRRRPLRNGDRAVKSRDPGRRCGWYGSFPAFPLSYGWLAACLTTFHSLQDRVDALLRDMKTARCTCSTSAGPRGNVPPLLSLIYPTAPDSCIALVGRQVGSHAEAAQRARLRAGIRPGPQQ